MLGRHLVLVTISNRVFHDTSVKVNTLVLRSSKSFVLIRNVNILNWNFHSMGKNKVFNFSSPAYNEKNLLVSQQIKKKILTSLFFSSSQGDTHKITCIKQTCFPSPLLTNTRKICSTSWHLIWASHLCALKAPEVQNWNLSESSVVFCKALPAPLTTLLMEQTPTVGIEGTCSCQHQTFHGKADLVQLKLESLN